MGRFRNSTILQRFWALVTKTETCWFWTGYVNSDGYGRTRSPLDPNIRPAMAHRIAYNLVVGAIPEGLEVHHICNNRLCVNPDHMELVTHDKHLREKTIRVRKTHCVRGHEFTKENSYWTPSMIRSCRTCKRMNERQRYAQGKIK